MRHRSRAMAFFNKWEKLLMYFTVCCLVMLLLSQALLYRDGTRKYLSWVDKIEGDSIMLSYPGSPGSSAYGNSPVAITISPQRPTKSIVLKVLKPDYTFAAWVNVNGRRVADFGRGEVRLDVFEGDFIEIDATHLDDQATFNVRVTEEGVLSPKSGMTFSGRAAMLSVGSVKFNH